SRGRVRGSGTAVRRVGADRPAADRDPGGHAWDGGRPRVQQGMGLVPEPSAPRAVSLHVPVRRGMGGRVQGARRRAGARGDVPADVADAEDVPALVVRPRPLTAVRISFSGDVQDFLRPSWVRVVDADPAATFFHMPRYLKLYWEEF